MLKSRVPKESSQLNDSQSSAVCSKSNMTRREVRVCVMSHSRTPPLERRMRVGRVKAPLSRVSCRPVPVAGSLPADCAGKGSYAGMISFLVPVVRDFLTGRPCRCPGGAVGRCPGFGSEQVRVCRGKAPLSRVSGRPGLVVGSFPAKCAGKRPVPE